MEWWEMDVIEKDARRLQTPDYVLVGKIYQYLAGRCQTVKNEGELRLLIEMIYTINNFNGLYGEPYEPHRQLMLNLGLGDAKYQMMIKEQEFHDKIEKVREKSCGLTFEQIDEVIDDVYGKNRNSA